MAWETDMVLMLRFLINDVDAPQTYSDAKLKQLLAVAAQYTTDEVDFPTTYAIDINTPSISPDPTSGTKDAPFMSLVTLKAACLFDNWGYRSKIGVAGISIRSGPDSVSTTGQLSGYQWILQYGACKGYEDAKWDYLTGNSSPGRAILGPFCGWNINTDIEGGRNG